MYILKEMVRFFLVLQSPWINGYIMLHSNLHDKQKENVACVLMEHQQDEKKNTLRYLRREVRSTEKNFDIKRKEFHAFVCSFPQLKLAGRSRTPTTDGLRPRRWKIAVVDAAEKFVI